MPITESVTSDWTSSLEPGQRFKALERHVRSLGLTPVGYRRRWGLPKDYPMAASNYAAFRSGIGRALGRRELKPIALCDLSRIFPPQVEQGKRKSSTFDWIISRCADGTQKTAPREVIHLLNSLRETEISRLERGVDPAPGEQLVDRSVFKEALPQVSEARFGQHLLAEHPELRDYVMQLSGEKTEQTLESLSAIWGIETGETAIQAQALADVCFFQSRGSRDRPTYWVPFLYRDALSMSQGLADEGKFDNVGDID